MQVIVDGLPTNYEVSGDGKPVVLLHGWGDNAKGHRELGAILGKRYKVITPDLPGFGATATPAQAWDLTNYAQFLQAFLTKIDTKDVYAFIGHSNGGAIAVRGLGQRILTADRLVLLASAGVRDIARPNLTIRRVAAKTGKLLAVPLPAGVQRTLRRKLYERLGSDMLVAEHMQETFKRIVADDVRSDASKIRVPTLLIYGEADKDTPVAYGELLHELIPDSTLEVMPGAGHFIFQDRPHEVEKTIMEFLR